ncbi:type I-C CRISPR-associated protein Cas8c/Csd1 [Methylobacterium sp. WL30]|uniref:type I-C CRISPR-associated protein Cas8c/Csd1 n=1 Tax=unclassified Methylobacterium TaxID=2615210 RepID=UPI0011C893D1|nr:MULTISPECIES: type I-C CRISPR-associated protein Cas8c/Csd1 [unclassified Methylobacterium]TXN40545.1 type I-C CRISPR-associated protein Cas8c/Csd1 [Methylobacterium sp. WL93]TXN49646.1 type I-C CRISPR-associated protein Cas8c/Csd1 [Methylobacterium sp. WL119]TXN66145.1 type I-C CRISPR-associated protein Cas8c/Csd1 [Methylobacterium sp. WL30]
MTVLQALDRYYTRMAERGEAEAPGFSREKIGFCLTLSPDGDVVDILDLRDHSSRKPQPRLMEVPAAVKRTVAIVPNRLWDKSAYVLGRTAGPGRRTAEEHEAFKALHRDLLANSDDPGLLALARFLDRWDPANLDALSHGADLLDANLVFRLGSEHAYLHQRDAARRLIAVADGPAGGATVCLVTGLPANAARLHPSIKGVAGAQSSGAALVSFNLDAFTSYGKVQGANAPVGEAVAFRYGAALNRMLDRGSRNRLARPIGDATVVFWADTSEAVGEAQAAAAEDWFGQMFAPAPADDQEAAKLRDALDAVAAGRAVAEIVPSVVAGTRFHVLGLAPNAARLSVRYWLDDTFESFAQRLARHHANLRLEPLPRGWGGAPSIARLLVRTTALQEKYENVPPLLAGEVARAVLGGGRYPRTWLAAAITRLRAGDDPATGWHAAAIRACLVRDQTGDIPVSLAKDDPHAAYQLGRLFAALETAQRLALGPVNASIRDRYFGAASATPAGVFPLLLRGAQNHMGKLRKERKDGWIEREIAEIVERLPPALPRSLKLEAQGRFAIGYYHQRQAQFAGRPTLQAAVEAEAGDNEEIGDDV